MNTYQLMNSFKLLTLAIIAIFVFNTASYAQSCHFGGSWDTNYGKMTLSQSGRSVSGSVGGEKITGEVQGYIFQGSYWGTSYPADVTFYISPDCNEIHGEYLSGQTSKEWYGTRISRQPRPPSSPPPGYVQKSGGYGLPTYSNQTTSNYYTKPVSRSSYNWNGVWATKSGNVRLQKTGGNSVEGTYTLNSKTKGVIQGIIKATISGNQIIGFWSEGPTYTAPNDAGDFYFTMSSTGNSFTGQWRPGHDQHNRPWKANNTWNGKRISY